MLTIFSTRILSQINVDLVELVKEELTRLMILGPRSSSGGASQGRGSMLSETAAPLSAFPTNECPSSVVKIAPTIFATPSSGICAGLILSPTAGSNGPVAATRSRSRKSCSEARSFDPREEHQWLLLVLRNVTELVPENVRSGALFDDAASFETKKKKAVDLADDPVTTEESSSSTPVVWGKVGVDLYKRLFVAFREYECLGHAEGCQLVAEIIETLLKLRLKRVHSSLLKTYLASVIDVLSCKHFSLRGASTTCSSSNITKEGTGIQLSNEVEDLVQQLRLLEPLVDAIVTPCDDETFAGVLTYIGSVKERLAQLVLSDDRLGLANPQSISQGGSSGNGPNAIPGTSANSVLGQCAIAVRNASDSNTCEGAWRALHATVSLVRQHGNELSSTQLARDIKPCKILGLICHALVLKRPNTKASRQTAACVLTELAECESCLRAIRCAVMQFDDAWPYLLQPILEGSDQVVAVTVASVVQSMLHHRTSLPAGSGENDDAAELRHLLMACHADRFAKGIESSNELNGLVGVLSELLYVASPLPSQSTAAFQRSPKPLSGGRCATIMEQTQRDFHIAVARAACKRLDPTADGRQQHTSATHAIPLIQYVGKACGSNYECSSLQQMSTGLYRSVAYEALSANVLDVLEFWMYAARSDIIATSDLSRIQQQVERNDSAHSTSGSSSGSSNSSSILSMKSVARGLSSIFRSGRGKTETLVTKHLAAKRPNNVLYGVCYKPFVHLLNLKTIKKSDQPQQRR